LRRGVARDPSSDPAPLRAGRGHDWAVGAALRKWDVIKRRLERGKRVPFITLAVVMDAAIGRRLDSISGGVCPYCGRELKPRSSMVLHLNGGTCGRKLREDIVLALSLHRALMEMVRKSGISAEPFKVCLRPRQDSPAPSRLCLYFKTKLEAVRFLVGAARSGQAVIPLEFPSHVDELLRRAGLNGGDGAARG